MIQISIVLIGDKTKSAHLWNHFQMRDAQMFWFGHRDAVLYATARSFFVFPAWPIPPICLSRWCVEPYVRCAFVCWFCACFRVLCLDPFILFMTILFGFYQVISIMVYQQSGSDKILLLFELVTDSENSRFQRSLPWLLVVRLGTCS